ncbi:MAG: hypothetical protein AB8G96_10840 [Phycisphaerales bacterium]
MPPAEKVLPAAFDGIASASASASAPAPALAPGAASSFVANAESIVNGHVASAGSLDVPRRTNAFEHVLGPAAMQAIRHRVADRVVDALREADAASTLADDQNLVRVVVEEELDDIVGSWRLVAPGRVWIDGESVIGSVLSGSSLPTMRDAAKSRGSLVCDNAGPGVGTGSGSGSTPETSTETPPVKVTVIDLLRDALADGAEDAVAEAEGARADRAEMAEEVEAVLVNRFRGREDNTSCRQFQDCGWFVYDDRLECWYNIDCDPGDYTTGGTVIDTGQDEDCSPAKPSRDEVEPNSGDGGLSDR